MAPVPQEAEPMAPARPMGVALMALGGSMGQGRTAQGNPTDPDPTGAAENPTALERPARRRPAPGPTARANPTARQLMARARRVTPMRSAGRANQH